MNKKKRYILSPITGIIQNIFDIKNPIMNQTRIIIHSNKKIIVSPCNGQIKNYHPKKIKFIIQSEYGAQIVIKNKLFKKNNQKYIYIPINTESINIYAGKILFLIKSTSLHDQSIYLQTTVNIICKQKINNLKKKLHKTQAGITVLASI
ncbi:PTS glucose transporter subunit IIA [Buchnera aphidicola]|uniref:PTS system glucose-specific EIIA component n=1 Tax=Buchnera aphidicola (Cinara cf. splendens/pseudotsugae 3390) TaxID=2518980 RepID=A0A451CWL5_9GAMM|nr:PTS glucose transporter subunit IIA [Buchnera aphidicola]VFP77610.1 PTS system glucose-specific EIIA component [Buchnera aphidicola (Cinara cf. splendens/pseudotsugae 3390)]